MDIEWGKDGGDGQLYILQARPETVQSRQAGGTVQRYRWTSAGALLIEGRAIGQKIGAGAVRVLTSVEADARVRARRGAGRRHDRPGLGADHEAGLARSSPTGAAAPATRRSSPASWASRRWSAPARPPGSWPTGRPVTVSCAEGDTGFVYDGLLDFTVTETELDAMPDIAGQDHDERRHARTRRSRSPGCRTPASGWPGWSSSSTGRSASTPRRCSTSTRWTGRSRTQISRRGRGVRQPAGLLRQPGRRGRRRCSPRRSRRTR